MSKFLIKANYTAPTGVKGLLTDGGSSRRESVVRLIEGLGGKLEAFYYAYGDTDVYAIIDAPDAITAIAVSLNVNASGFVSVSTVPLITPEELDQATKMQVAYRPPGVGEELGV